MVSPLPELGRDIALLSLCMGGINTIDLYELKKKDYKNGIIGYKRAKTRHSRRDEAYMEIRIEPFIQDTFNKYLSTDRIQMNICLIFIVVIVIPIVSMPI